MARIDSLEALSGVDYYSGATLSLGGVVAPCRLQDLCVSVGCAGVTHVNGIYSMATSGGRIKTYAG